MLGRFVESRGYDPLTVVLGFIPDGNEVHRGDNPDAPWSTSTPIGGWGHVEWRGQRVRADSATLV